MFDAALARLLMYCVNGPTVSLTNQILPINCAALLNFREVRRIKKKSKFSLSFWDSLIATSHSSFLSISLAFLLLGLKTIEEKEMNRYLFLLSLTYK